MNFSSLKKNKLFCNLLIISSFIILSFLSCTLLLRSHILYTSFDIQFHFRRIMELRESMMKGNIFPNFSFNQFHGSAVMTLYPYLNLLPAVFLSFIIKSKIILIYAFFIFNILLTFIISFYSSKDYIKSNITAYVFSVIYSLSNVFLYYNFITSDFGIVSSYTFLPLIIFGFMKIIQGKNSWIELSLGMSLLLYAHVLNVFIISAFLVLIFIINIKRINKRIIINILRSILLFIVITSIIWLPFLRFYFNNLHDINMPPIYQLDNVNLKIFIKGLYGSKDNYTIGFFPIVSMIISIFFYKKFDRYIKQMYLLSLFIVLSVLFLPWKFITSYDFFHFLNQIQFTFRFFLVPQMVFTFILSLIITQYIKFYKKLIVILTIFISIIMQMTIGQYATINRLSGKPSIEYYLKAKQNSINSNDATSYPIRNSLQFDLILDTYNQEYDDYIPKNGINMSNYVNRNIGFYNDNQKIKINHIDYNTFNFNGENNINKISLPLYLYNKEKLNVYLNNQSVHYYTNKDGLLTIDNIKDNVKENNKIYIKAPTNKSRITGVILSILGWSFMLMLFIKNKFIKKE